MRFKRGSKVEVMNQKEVPISWRCAEIVSGNGHTYSVRYDLFADSMSDLVVERVPRKVIRPCPPPVEAGDWVAGDVVEVFYETSWKIATVLKVVGMDYYMVRLHGIFLECRVHRSSLRTRQSWQDDNWVVIGKGSGTFGNAKSNKRSTSKCHLKVSCEVPQEKLKTKPRREFDYHAVQDQTGARESLVVSSRTLKRASPYSSSLLEAHTGKVLKRRAVEKEGRNDQVMSTPIVEKVDAVAYPRQNLGKKYVHASVNNRSKGHYEMERAKLNGFVGCSPARSSEPNGYDSDICSVGSCSITSESPCKFSSRFVAIPCNSLDTLCSDAESFFGSRDEEESCSFESEEEVAASVHRLELHAYRCTLEALYASGPLSWEQEELLTNLRITLHISNDEHLMEVRNLVSAGGGNRTS